MNRITHPLSRGTQGPPVADLHSALQALLDRAAILENDESARHKAAAALRRDLPRQSYGEATEKLVSIFQKERRLQPSGEVDGPTADVLNKLLNELGLLDPAGSPAARLVTGVVRREDNLPLQGVTVRALHQAEQGAIRLEEDTTDAEGRYTIRYDALPGVDAINLRVTAVDENGKRLQSSDVIRTFKAMETVNLTIPDAVIRVSGQLFTDHGAPAEGIILGFYRRAFGGGGAKLGEAVTGRRGVPDRHRACGRHRIAGSTGDHR